MKTHRAFRPKHTGFRQIPMPFVQIDNYMDEDMSPITWHSETPWYFMLREVFPDVLKIDWPPISTALEVKSVEDGKSVTMRFE